MMRFKKDDLIVPVVSNSIGYHTSDIKHIKLARILDIEKVSENKYIYEIILLKIDKPIVLKIDGHVNSLAHKSEFPGYCVGDSVSVIVNDNYIFQLYKGDYYNNSIIKRIMILKFKN